MENQSIPYYQLSHEEALQSLKTQRGGLTVPEAKGRLQLYGPNKLVSVDNDPLIFKFLRQFKDLMVIILIVAGSFSLFLREYRDAIIMYSIVLVNAVIGFVQEYKAERIMNSLKSMVVARAKVIRGGVTMEILGEELVPGDIVHLEEGDAIPADVRLIEENTFGANDFSLTGESNPVRKFLHPIPSAVPLGERNNMAFLGTTVATGNGIGVVVATGMQTEIGHIAHLSQETNDDISPLQKEMNHVSVQLTRVTLMVAAALFFIGLGVHFSLRESFLFALGIAASMVPEGLPAQVSVALSLAAGRLAAKNAVVKKLSAVETLGSTHIICTDKTGTLTRNEMTVQKIVIGKTLFDVSGSGYEPNGNVLTPTSQPFSQADLAKYKLFFEIGVFASNAHVSPPDAEHGDWYAIGDPTEAALITLGKKAGLDPVQMDRDFPELREFTFDAVRKRMSSLRVIGGKTFVFVKGSAQSVLERSTRMWENGAVRPLTQEDRDFFKKIDDDHATLALRNLAYAYRPLDQFSPDLTMELAESELIFMGMVSMIDPPRDEVAAAMESALRANIRVIIITGDYALTAAAIAQRIGLSKPGHREITVVNGSELQKLSDIGLLHKLIYSNLIFSRTAPEDKLRIVTLLKKAGEIVAVTGDGVNDAPALKKADIGVAMGKTGTEVAKDSAEIILLDDSFATLVSAIHEGRTIFQNLKKTIMSSLTSNSGELFAILISLVFTALFKTPLAILAVQVLAVDLIGEMLPLTFLTWDPPLRNLMTEPPRVPDDHIMKKSAFIDLVWSGFLMGGLAYLNFIFLFVRESVSSVDIAPADPLYMRACTLTYITIVLAQWVNILSRRAGEDSVWSSYLWSNKRLILSYFISLFFLLNIVYNPYISQFLHTGPMTFIDWVYALLGAGIYLAVREGYKTLGRRQKLALQKA